MHATPRSDLVATIQGLVNRLPSGSLNPEVEPRIWTCVELIGAGEERVALEILLSNLFEFDVSLSVVEAAQLMLAAEHFGVDGEDVDLVAVHDAVLPIGLFRTAVRRRSDRWDEHSIAWKLTLGKVTPQPSAWLDLSTGSGDGQMILWVSGEVDLVWGVSPSWEATEEHREISSELGLEMCLDDLEAAVIANG